MISVGTIEDIVSPRYIIEVSNNKAYISDWGSNSIHILDLNRPRNFINYRCGKWS